MLQFNLSKYFYILTAEPIWQLLPFRGRLTKLFNSIEIAKKKLPWTPKKVKSYGNPLPFPPFKNTLIWIILLGFIAPTINPSTSLFPILILYSIFSICLFALPIFFRKFVQWKISNNIFPYWYKKSIFLCYY